MANKTDELGDEASGRVSSTDDEPVSEGGRSPRRRRSGKRDLVLRAARRVFASDGYGRSSIDAIAQEAGVSTRTIYNHFDGKDDLFAEVLETSAGEVSASFAAAVAALPEPSAASLRDRLVGLGQAIAAHRYDFPEHFAMIRQITADARHFPPTVIEQWQQAGPQRVQATVAEALGASVRRGELDADDLDRAALHLIALVMTVGARSWREPGPKEIDAAVVAGVDAFLGGYAAR